MTSLSPSEELRSAAEKIRKRAEKAASGPWNVDGPFWWGPECTGDGVQPSSTISDPDRVSLAIIPSPLPDAHPRSEESAQWIAMMSPALAEPLASLLEHLAERDENAEAELKKLRDQERERAIRIVRAHLVPYRAAPSADALAIFAAIEGRDS